MLNNIEFPVFLIGKHEKIYSEDGIAYIELSNGKVQILDNKNLGGNFAARRRKIKNKYSFKGTCFTIQQLLKSKYLYFCDNTGKVYKYKKTKFVSVVCKKVKSFSRVEGKGYLLELEGISYPFLVSAMVYSFQPYVQLIKLGGSYLIFDFCHEYRKPTRKKV